MKGISEVLAVVLMLAITVALAGMVWSGMVWYIINQHVSTEMQLLCLKLSEQLNATSYMAFSDNCRICQLNNCVIINNAIFCESISSETQCHTFYRVRT